MHLRLSLTPRVTSSHVCSHTWGSGQNQMQALKKELLLLVPSMEVFLDVENLTSIGDLEQLVAKSDSVLIFLSRGWW